MSAIILNGSFIHYEALGRGRPVIFLHGWVGSWSYWFDSMQIASGSHRAYGIDLFGFGDTVRDAAKYGIESQAGMLAEFLTEMDLRRVAIVGHGLGALVGMKLASDSPPSVDRILAVNCPLTYDDIHPRLRQSSPADLPDWLSNRNIKVRDLLSDASKTDPGALSASLDSFKGDNLFATFRITPVMSLFVNGSEDPVISAPNPVAADSMPYTMHKITLKGAGHFPMLDQPNYFNRLLMDFLLLGSGKSPKELHIREITIPRK